MNTPRISIVVALGKNGTTHNTIGKDNKLLWHISEDLKRFKKITLKHPIIMGRKTFESIGRPLPERVNIVVTRNKSWVVDGVKICHSLDEALEHAKSLDSEEIFVCGGSEIYAQALPFVDRLYLTLVDDEKDADSFFPEWNEFTKEIDREEKRDEKLGVNYVWVTLERA
jgi:dihydrofolate reductase